MAKSKRRVGRCVHCGKRRRLTDDHVPPALLFPRPRPSDLITVPACRECNGGASGDDEYFRWAITARHDVGDLPEVQQVTPAVLRGLARPQARGFLESVFQSITGVEVKSPAGLYLGTVPGYMVSLRRLDKVVCRTITGLFYREFGRRLPNGYEATAYIEDGLRRVDPASLEQLRRWCSIVQGRPPKTIGGSVFSYWFQSAEGDRHTTFWVLLFYQKVGFVGMTAPTRLIPRKRPAGGVGLT